MADNNRKVSCSQDRLLVALKQLMAKKRYETITVTELCRVAGLSRNTFYKFFPEKKELLTYLQDHLLLEYVRYKDSHVFPLSKPVLEAYVFYFSFWLDMRDWVDILVKQGLWEQIAAPNTKSLTLLNTRQKNPYVLSSPQIMQMLQTFVASGCALLVKDWSLHNFDATPLQLAELVVSALSEPVVSMLSASHKQIVV